MKYGMTAEGSADDQRALTQTLERSTASIVTETERKVVQVIAEILELQWVSPEDDILSLGGDSFEAVRIALELEHVFDVEFPVEMLENAGRVRDLAAWIDGQCRLAPPKV